jgi:hypothetical protein
VRVGVQVKIAVKGDPAEVGLRKVEFEKFDPGRGIGGTEEASRLPEVPNPPKSPGRLGFGQRSSGVVIKPTKDAPNELEILAYNTSEPVRGSNVSHAEEQSIYFLMEQSPDFLARIETIDAIVIGKEICVNCAASIRQLKVHINAIKKDRGLPAVTINWLRGD